MKQRNAFIVAIALTAFVLVLIGGIVARGAAIARPTTAGVEAATATPQIQAQVPATAAPTSAPVYPVSPNMAAAIALSAAPGTSLTRTPELVNFQGTVAYEVLLDRGTTYIDATTGAILYNDATIAVAPLPGFRRGGEERDGGENEGGG